MPKEKISILIAESKPPIINSVKSTLKDSSDIKYTFETARSANDAIKKAAINNFDVFLMDHNLPDKSGLAVLQHVLKKKMGIPVILIVAEGEERLGVKAMDKGAYDYLTKKEIKTIALNRAIRRAIQRKRLENDIRESLERMERLAIRDGLTGLYNQRHFREVLRSEYKKSKRHLQALSCIMIDLDYFKSVNDNYGHQFGDFVLIQSARILKEKVRDTDFVARYGGEEFIIILPNTSLNGAYILAERIRSAFAKHVFRKGEISQVVTVSIGVSSTTDRNVIGDEDLISNADNALYAAKRKGRNLVCLYDDSAVNNPAGIREETSNIIEFRSRLNEYYENIKERCIESAHEIMRGIEKGLDNINTHSVRVSFYAEKLANEISSSREESLIIKRAALLHDIGMVGVDMNIFKKRGRLNKQEYENIKKHTNIGVKLIERTRIFDKELPLILYHHERFDGSGYPHKLMGENIPLGARILAVAEAFDVMTSGHHYKKARSNDDAIAELKDCAGTQFDPSVVREFVKIARKGL